METIYNKKAKEVLKKLSEISRKADILLHNNIKVGIYNFIEESSSSFYPVGNCGSLYLNTQLGGFDPFSGRATFIDGELEVPTYSDAMLLLVNHKGILFPYIFYIDCPETESLLTIKEIK